VLRMGDPVVEGKELQIEKSLNLKRYKMENDSYGFQRSFLSIKRKLRGTGGGRPFPDSTTLFEGDTKIEFEGGGMASR